MMYDDIVKLCDNLNCQVFRDVPLAKYTSFKIGGPADLLINVHNTESLKTIIKEINRLNYTHFVMGNGSNLLVSDLGYRGIILRLTKDFNKVLISSSDSEIIECGAGASLARACVFAMKNSLSGLEFAWGIPGTCGGAIFMNAGAYGGEMSNILVKSTHVTNLGVIESFSRDQMDLSYRKSAYTKNRFTVISMSVKLSSGDQQKIKNSMNDYISRRRNKQPLEYPSAGSVFKRPEGNFAGTLIEKCGLKGKSFGGAMVSQKHAGFIINTGNATCSDVLMLIDFIKNCVFNKTGIALECEIKTLGEF